MGQGAARLLLNPDAIGATVGHGLNEGPGRPFSVQYASDAAHQLAP